MSNLPQLNESMKAHVTPEPCLNPHASEIASILQTFLVHPAEGLSETEVVKLRSRFGVNALQTIKPRQAWRMLLDQFASLIVALLAAAVVVAVATSDWIDALAILVVLILNALVGFATEWKAGRALEALRKETRTTARVRRDGHEKLIAAADLVPGDIMILNAGDRVAADARLIEAHSLRVEESALTGESLPVEKSTTPVAEDAPLADRHSMLYLGTSIAAGRALAVVTATGAATEFGHIGRLVAETTTEVTPLKRRLDELGRRLVYLVLVIGVIVTLAGWWRGEPLWMMVEVGISLAVAAVPEALPAVTTLILALGVVRLAREHALVRRLASVETLGSTTVICTDKTGTLTENRMQVRSYALADGRVVEWDKTNESKDELCQRILRAGVLCSEAVFHSPDQAVGDPTETALLEVAHHHGISIEKLRNDFPKLAEVPFDAETQQMVTLHRTPSGAALAVLKGAPGIVLESCSHYTTARSNLTPLTPEMRQHFLNDNRQMADRALRVLALAEKPLDAATHANWQAGEFVFLGLAGMLDPPRNGVAEAIAQARAAGIRTVMLTGDQLNTARAIARELKLQDGAEPQALQARDLPADEEANQARLAELARTTDVFARVSPADKLRIVTALQQAGETVAVTGDGVNDAPALKRADIGVAMGLRGTEVAKEAADLVLADDNFATILRAVAGGRTIYANIIKFVHLMFSKNFASVLVIFTAIIIGLPLPLLPLQILWVNLVTDIFPALALALEPATPDVLQRQPRSPQTALLSRSFLTLIIWQGFLLAAVILAAYVWALQEYGAGTHAQTIALFALIGVQIGHSFNCRSRIRSAFDGLFRNPYLWWSALLVALLQGLALNVTALSSVLHLTPLNRNDWHVIALCIVTPLVVVELAKLWTRATRMQYEEH